MFENYFPLIHGIIDAFIFLESSGANEVNPDSAVRCMENISSSLLTLGRSDQITLRLHLQRIAEEAGDRTYGKFVREMADMIGLASP
jgi:hypothetical protein